MSKGLQRFPLTRHFLLTIFSYLAAFAIAASAFAQSPGPNLTPASPTHLAFVSASVTPYSMLNRAFTRPAAGTPAPASQVKFYAMSLRQLIMLAYNVNI
jgi:hypothetical protein